MDESFFNVRGPWRGLRIEQYARAQSGIWYYQVDIELRFPRLRALWEDEEDCDDDSDVQYYSVRRRYSEFLQLYEKIKEEIVSVAMERSDFDLKYWVLPPFPQKEYISSAVLGLLWRTTTSLQVLEERRRMFEKLLHWIEQHSILRESPAYIEFLGAPPQLSDGYVSLKEYTSQNWLSSLEQLREKRRRRSCSECSSCSLPQDEKVTSFIDVRRQYVHDSTYTVTQYMETRRKRYRRDDGPGKWKHMEELDESVELVVECRRGVKRLAAPMEDSHYNPKKKRECEPPSTTVN
ncbi:hypothetical protein Poli38472_002341 [Pythium oligandrum]|uniref:PX domain-containing protein n=1 Tax=Pythium oligandrum TaxID=41045 RepID=A0A8K1CHN0_PYTOL|nr:hypothetical protein Poli38472_002341 [Pythium oligandrum]|eukprot:TMW63400.1 hypothetical protein Poli38472_002341 [Pythium oligandrum]